MKGYGLPRDKDIEQPDVADIKKYGLNTSAGGRDYFKNKMRKNAVRRYWKRRARREGRIIENVWRNKA